MTDRSTTSAGGRTVHEGAGIEAFRRLVIAQGHELYAKTRMLPNGAWTPTAMLRNAKAAACRETHRGSAFEITPMCAPTKRSDARRPTQHSFLL
jgi:hypothetical protein